MLSDNHYPCIKKKQNSKKPSSPKFTPLFKIQNSIGGIFKSTKLWNSQSLLIVILKFSCSFLFWYIGHIWMPHNLSQQNRSDITFLQVLMLNMCHIHTHAYTKQHAIHCKHLIMILLDFQCYSYLTVPWYSKSNDNYAWLSVAEKLY